MLSTILWIIVVILLIAWLGGLALNIAGGLIHILLVIGLIVLLVNLVMWFMGRNTADV